VGIFTFQFSTLQSSAANAKRASKYIHLYDLIYLHFNPSSRATMPAGLVKRLAGFLFNSYEPIDDFLIHALLRFSNEPSVGREVKGGEKF
jgi:hypothetical protein